MSDEAIYKALLQQQAFAVFEFVGDGAFRLVGEPPDFCLDILGEEAIAGNNVRFGHRFPFLESFINEAQVVWESPSGKPAESGAWVERTMDGRELGLEATALCLLGRRILLIQNPQEKYARRVELLQAARNASLQHERLQREIQKKEILLHCIVHDLSQPLTVMRGAFSLLELQELPPRLIRTVEIAQLQSVRQEEMIREILTAFSADLAAQNTFEHDPTKAPDLAECARNTVEGFRDAFMHRGARIELDPALDLKRAWTVRGEETRLLRIYGNLVENALRHSPPDSVVTLGVIDEGQYFRAFVNDQGQGVPSDETASRLFGLFAKGKTAHGGKAGLGLYFCKVNVERWGGTIGCESRSDGGAHFWFRLPRV